jgi:hypothetical protein
VRRRRRFFPDGALDITALVAGGASPPSEEDVSGELRSLADEARHGPEVAALVREARRPLGEAVGGDELDPETLARIDAEVDRQLQRDLALLAAARAPRAAAPPPQRAAPPSGSRRFRVVVRGGRSLTASADGGLRPLTAAEQRAIEAALRRPSPRPPAPPTRPASAWPAVAAAALARAQRRFAGF